MISEDAYLTDEQYVRTRGLMCPKCHGPDIDGAGIDPENATQDCRCNGCDFTWVENYVLAGWEFAE